MENRLGDQGSFAVPQDVGTRGVEGRDRDPLMAGPRVRDRRAREADARSLERTAEPSRRDRRGRAGRRGRESDRHQPSCTCSRCCRGRTSATTVDRDGHIRRLLAPIELYGDLPRAARSPGRRTTRPCRGIPTRRGRSRSSRPTRSRSRRSATRRRPVGVATARGALLGATRLLPRQPRRARARREQREQDRPAPRWRDEARGARRAASRPARQGPRQGARRKLCERLRHAERRRGTRGLGAAVDRGRDGVRLGDPRRRQGPRRSRPRQASGNRGGRRAPSPSWPSSETPTRKRSRTFASGSGGRATT